MICLPKQIPLPPSYKSEQETRCVRNHVSNATDLREIFRSLHRDLHSFSIKSDSFKVHHSVTRSSSSRPNQSEKCVSLIPLLPTPLWGFKLFPLKQKALLLAGSESPLTSRSFKKNPGVVFITTLFVIEWAANFSLKTLWSRSGYEIHRILKRLIGNRREMMQQLEIIKGTCITSVAFGATLISNIKVFITF